MIYKEMFPDDFIEWLHYNSSYYRYFSNEAAEALFNWLDEMSEQTPENLIFDPVAWCCTFSEYDSLIDFNNQYFGEEYKKGSEYTLETLQYNTTVIELENGHIIVEDF